MFFWALIGCVQANPDDMVMHMNVYNHDNFWRKPPTVVLCTTESQFSVSDVEKVLALWERPYKKIVTRSKCSLDLERGVIKITDNRGLSDDEWGYTSYYYYDVYRESNDVVYNHEVPLIFRRREAPFESL